MEQEEAAYPKLTAAVENVTYEWNIGSTTYQPEPSSLGSVILLGIIAAFGTVLNLVLFVFICARMFSARYVSHAALCLADVIVCGFVMPVGLFATDSLENNWSLCVGAGAVMTAALVVSTQTVACIALGRFLHVCYPQTYRRFFSDNLTALYTVCTYVYAILWAVLCALLSSYTYKQHAWMCIPDIVASPGYVISLYVTNVLLPAVVLVFLYGLVLHKVRTNYNALSKRTANRALTDRQHRSPSEKVRKQKSSRLLIVLIVTVVTFLLLWGPMALAIVVSIFADTVPQTFVRVSLWAALSNSAANAVVYGILNRRVQSEASTCRRKFFGLGQQPQRDIPRPSCEESGSFIMYVNRRDKIEQGQDKNQVNSP